MERLLGALPKISVVVFVIVIFFNEIRKGYFDNMKTFSQTFKPKIHVITLICVVVAIAGVFLFDPYLLKTLQGLPGSFPQKIADFGGMIGRNVNPWFFLGTVYLAAVVIRQRKWQQVVFGSLFSCVCASAISSILKFLFLRARPIAELGHLSFFNLSGLAKDARAFQSFTSGDVAVVAGIAGYLFFGMKNQYLRWIVLLFPIATSFARINGNKHWPSDTVMAMILGICMGYIVTSYETMNQKRA